MLNAGRVTHKGEPLEDWKVRNVSPAGEVSGGARKQPSGSTSECVAACDAHTQDVLVRESSMVYNKEELLNTCFVVFGKRRS